MVIKVDKCVIFGIKKFSSRSLQYAPKLSVNNRSVPTVKSAEPFKYLGRYFNFEMGNKVHKEKLQSSLVDMLTNIDSLSILPKNKLLLYQRYLLSKISWHLTVANLAKTWISENLDSITIRSIRQWLDLEKFQNKLLLFCYYRKVTKGSVAFNLLQTHDIQIGNTFCNESLPDTNKRAMEGIQREESFLGVC